MIASKRLYGGLFTAGSLSWLTFYKHLSDTGGDFPKSIGDLSLIKQIGQAIGTVPKDKSFKIIHGGSSFTNAILADGHLETVLSRYSPSWFYFHPTVGSIVGVLL